MDSFTPYHTHTQSNDYSTHSGHYLSSSSLPTSSSRHLTIHDLYSHVGDLRSTSHPEYRSELENSPFPSATRVIEPPSHNIYLSPAPAPSSSFSEYEESSRQPPEVCENSSTDVGNRSLWLWRCVEEALPRGYGRQVEMWQSLLDMDDIWLMWDIGDELGVPKPETYVPVLERHFSGQCGLDVSATSSEGAHHQFEIRFALILWKSLLACRRTKYKLRPSSIRHEIPSLVSKWWDMLPKSVKDELVYFSDTRPKIWNDFCAMLKRRGHACYEDLPDETMWKVLITMHLLCAIPWPYLPFHPVNCAGCLKIQSQPSGLNLKPHLIPLFCIPSQIHCYFSDYYEELDYENSAPTSSKFWTDKWIRSNKRGGTKIKLLPVPNLLSQTSLREMDKWLSNLPSVDIGRKHTLGSFIPKEDWIPSHWVDLLQDNEDDLSVHWTETEAAVEAATGIAYSRYSPAPFTEEEVAEGSTTGWSSDPASWLCAVFLLSIVKSVDFGPQAARIFGDILRGEEANKFGLSLLLEQAPALRKSEATRAFQNSLEKSGHTCWTDLEALGENSIPDLYASAYFMLTGESEVPVVGCDQMDPLLYESRRDSKCRTCRIQDGLHDLSNALDNPKSTFGLSIDAKKMISNMNHDRYRTERRPLTQKNLLEFSQTLIETGNALLQQAQSICSSDCVNLDAHEWEEEEEYIICRGYMGRDSEDTDSGESSTPPPPPNHSEISSQSGSNDVALNGSSTANELLSFQEDYVEAAPDISLTSRTNLGLIPDQDSDKTTSGNHSINRPETQSTTKSSKPKTRDEMREEVKSKLLAMLESNKIDYGKGLPWKTLQDVVEDQDFEFVNWPKVKSKPLQLTKGDGIQKATRPEIWPLYKALNDEERPLQIRRKNAAERNASERAGNKRSRDEQEGDVERDSAAKRVRTAEPSNSRN
ncbi:hypothetical protein D9758_015841 [Tetrapyrgos nigripes]|uniref:Uncharacterized protein n=1 Tax=Tetrapyrgos nigripes TaxID=182062 RepID=A0A8H5C7Y9_9AGAR|nr:hypothetical protein D9758_015841 [Tetrapyrgos nigripes]